MSSKTKKIVVLHMKEIIYTAVFLILAIFFLILMLVMFKSKGDNQSQNAKKIYTPGTYTSALPLGSSSFEVEVTVDKNHINSIRFANLDETMTTMYPLMQPAIENIAEQIYDKQSLDDISLPEDNPYTSRVILDAISTALEKAAAN